jgi:hypothetical protein
MNNNIRPIWEIIEKVERNENGIINVSVLVSEHKLKFFHEPRYKVLMICRTILNTQGVYCHSSIDIKYELITTTDLNYKRLIITYNTKLDEKKDELSFFEI